MCREGHNSIMLPHYGPDLNSLTYPSSVLLYPLIPGLYDGDNRIAEAIFIQTVNFFRDREQPRQRKREGTKEKCARPLRFALSLSLTHTQAHAHTLIRLLWLLIILDYCRYVSAHPHGLMLRASDTKIFFRVSPFFALKNNREILIK